MSRQMDQEHYNMTFDEIGKELGVSKERTIQIYKKAEKKVKKAIKEKGLDKRDLYDK